MPYELTLVKECMGEPSKLMEALRELQERRKAIDDAITHLVAAMGVLGIESGDTTDLQLQGKKETTTRRRRMRHSYLDHAIAALATAGPIMQINDLVREVSQLAEKPVSRATLDGGISREIREDGERSRFARVEPGIYTLSEPGRQHAYRFVGGVVGDTCTV